MPEAPHVTRFVLEYDGEDRARVVETCLLNEVGEIDDDRSRTRLSRDGASVTIEIEARDLVALRAAGNTWLSLASVAERTADVAETVPF